MLNTVAVVDSRLETADAALRIGPNDPETHYTRALTLANRGRLEEAVAELRTAIRLRPHHYYEWLDLGVTLERLNDQNGALAAFNESVRLAPSFAQPRWQRGSFLFRQGKYDEAFADLRLAAEKNHSLFASLFDLAAVAANGDGAKIDALIKPQNTRDHLALANYLASHGKSADAARHVRAAGAPNEETDKEVLRATIRALIEAKQFRDAYLVWGATRGIDQIHDSGEVVNGNFTEPILQNDPGFGWQILSSSGFAASIDPEGPLPGSRSVFFQFQGEPGPGKQVLSQLVLVQPNTQYSLSLMVRTEALVTGGPPVVAVLDAESQQVLGQSSINVGSNGWEEKKIDFLTPKDTRAVMFVIRRLDCAQNPCPIFGKLWFGKFGLSRGAPQTSQLPTR